MKLNQNNHNNKKNHSSDNMNRKLSSKLSFNKPTQPFAFSLYTNDLSIV